jgi:hypothetical protein
MPNPGTTPEEAIVLKSGSVLRELIRIASRCTINVLNDYGENYASLSPTH